MSEKTMPPMRSPGFSPFSGKSLLRFLTASRSVFSPEFMKGAPELDQGCFLLGRVHIPPRVIPCTNRPVSSLGTSSPPMTRWPPAVFSRRPPGPVHLLAVQSMFHPARTPFDGSHAGLALFLPPMRVSVLTALSLF